MIPKIAHRVWLKMSDDDVIPERFEAYWQRFGELHPDWELRTWTDLEEVRSWIRCRDVFDRATTNAGRADVTRYELMWRFGGVYLDTDVEPLRSFDDLLDGPPFAGWENERLICPTVLGSPPEHPAFDAVLRFLPNWSKRMPPVKPNYQTGPVPFTRVWKDRDDVRLMPRETFYPVGWWEKDNLGGPYPPESYAVHHWCHSWKPVNGRSR